MSLIPAFSRTLLYPVGGPSCAVGLAWPTKAPDDVLDFSLDLSAWLCDSGQDSVGSFTAEVVATNGPAGTFEIMEQQLSGAILTIIASGGNSAVVYAIRLTVTTAAGRVLAIDVWLPVLPDGVFFPPWNGPAIATGPSVLTLGTLAAMLSTAPQSATSGVWIDATTGIVHWSAS